ncbi:hypothetical protein DNTS_010923 [Danionella cerebrum]|uniref:Microsomal glutathione S-transferase 1 n=1 Tax=Danionella cerebrum TaxID=2873325 RepID=A0A553PEC1_9TELE|nr:hypothetical protein DNTS_010923 [Danionella translucida]TRY76029.1 hypothetical protein DNTS_010923 [Danionella translucida]
MSQLDCDVWSVSEQECCWRRGFSPQFALSSELYLLESGRREKECYWNVLTSVVWSFYALILILIILSRKFEKMADMMNNDVFLAFFTYATIVILKMMFMAPLTGYFRVTRKAFSNWEDTAMIKNPEERKKMLQMNPDVERVRRCHQNDLENIIPFVLIGLLYAFTGPDLSTALIHFRIFVGSRFVHTFSYILALPQPSRALSWVTGMFTTFSMAYRVLTTALYL